MAVYLPYRLYQDPDPVIKPRGPQVQGLNRLCQDQVQVIRHQDIFQGSGSDHDPVLPRQWVWVYGVLVYDEKTWAAWQLKSHCRVISFSIF